MTETLTYLSFLAFLFAIPVGMFTPGARGFAYITLGFIGAAICMSFFGETP